MAPLIIGPNLAKALREQHGFDVTGHPDFVVHDPSALDALDIEIRPDTIERMRYAAHCQATANAIRAGKVKHAAPE